MNIHTQKTCAVVLATSLIAACGGGGGGSSPAGSVGTTPPPATAATQGTTRIGAITGFGSVFVDGERFETREVETEVRKDDVDSSEDELKVGMIIRVRASSKNDRGEWIADDIEFDEDVEGPIDSIGTDSLVVLGQTVNIIESSTYIDDGLTLADFSVGDILEVSGVRNELDEIDASFIERKNPGDTDEYEVLGQVRSLDLDARQFTIGDLRVNYELAELDDLDGGLEEGLLVEVEDGNLAYLAGDLTLDATKVEGENRFEFKDEDDRDEMDDDDGDHETEITGIITEVLSETAFLIGTIEVRHDGTTEFSGGTTLDLVTGARVEVEGDVIESNVLSADEIEFEPDLDDARLAGLVNEVDSENENITVMGIVVQLAGADIEDSVGETDSITVADLNPGDFVELRGTESDNQINAAELRREDADDSEMRGLLDDFDATAKTVTIFGRLIITDGATRYEVEDMPVDAAKFFERLHANQSVVDADWNGAMVDTAMPVKELSLED